MDVKQHIGTSQDMIQDGLNADKNALWSYGELFRNGRKPQLKLTQMELDDEEDVILSDVDERFRQQPRGRKCEEHPPPQREARKAETQSRPKNQPPSKKQCKHCEGHHPPLKCVVMEGVTGMAKICPIHPHMKNHYLDTCTSLYDWISNPDLLDALWTFMGPGRHGLPPIYSEYIDISELTRYLRKSWNKLPCSVDHARLMRQTHHGDLSKPMNYKERPNVPWFNEKVQYSQTDPQTAKRQPPKHGDIQALRAYLELNPNKPTPGPDPKTGTKPTAKPLPKPEIGEVAATVGESPREDGPVPEDGNMVDRLEPTPEDTGVSGFVQRLRAQPTESAAGKLEHMFKNVNLTSSSSVSKTYPKPPQAEPVHIQKYFGPGKIADLPDNCNLFLSPAATSNLRPPHPPPDTLKKAFRHAIQLFGSGENTGSNPGNPAPPAANGSLFRTSMPPPPPKGVMRAFINQGSVDTDFSGANENLQFTGAQGGGPNGPQPDHM
ncbi:hypothetical protein PG984_014527 [Apiospora sp. TS-2023a]